MILGDITKMQSLRKAIRGSDIVYHFAGISDIGESIKKPSETVKINIIGIANILQLCKKYKVKRIILASTIYVSSSQGGFYRVSKQASELMLEEYKKRFGLNYTITRFGSIYGPRSSKNNGLTKIIFNLLKHGNLQYGGTSKARRRLIHEVDAAKRYMSVDSYPINDANSADPNAIQTAEIPVFTSPVSGTRYDLRNYIDVRPRITDTANSVTALTDISRTPATSIEIIEPTGGLRFVAPGENFTTDYQYYLPRKDLIAMTSMGKFEVIKGAPQLDPKTPNPPPDGMQIAVIDVKPYPSLPQDNARRINTATAPNGRVDLGIKASPRRIRRFTMKDIQGLEKRIDNLEYYTSLSLLETDTKNLFLANASGVDRFKNGLIVDQFVDFVASDYYNEGFKIAIDKLKKEARPSFKVDDIQLEFLSANSTNVTATSKDATITIADTSKLFANGVTITQGSVTGKLDFQVDTKLYLSNTTGTFTTSTDLVSGVVQVHSSNVSSVSLPSAGKLVMLPWYHDAVIDQPFATDTRNLAGLFYSYKGVITLNPETDYWNDIIIKPSVQIEFGQFSKNFGSNALYGVGPPPRSSFYRY